MKLKKSGSRRCREMLCRCALLVMHVAVSFACAKGFAQSQEPRAVPESVGSASLPRPTPSEVDEEMRLVRDAFAEEYGRAVEFPLGLAKKLRETAEATTAPARKWVLLSEAQRLAIVAKDPDEAIGAAIRRASLFGLDAGDEVLGVISGLIDDAGSDKGGYYRLLVGFARDAIAARKIDVAERAITAAARMAQDVDREERRKNSERKLASRGTARPLPTKGRQMLEEVGSIKDAIIDMKKLREEYDKACVALAVNPDDPVANGLAGRYLCFVLGDWVEGVQKLSRSDLPGLRDAAKAELRVVSGGEPEPRAVFKAVDEWWQAAKAMDSAFASAAIKRHAVALYAIIESVVTDPLDKALIARRQAVVSQGDGFLEKK